MEHSRIECSIPFISLAGGRGGLGDIRPAAHTTADTLLDSEERTRLTGTRVGANVAEGQTREHLVVRGGRVETAADHALDGGHREVRTGVLVEHRRDRLRDGGRFGLGLRDVRVESRLGSGKRGRAVDVASRENEGEREGLAHDVTPYVSAT